MFKIVGDERNFPEFHQFYELGKQFVPFAQKKLGFNKPVDVELVSDPQNAKDPLGKTAYYDPNKMKITLFVDKRHVKDILRSLSHELVHHTQNCRGDFEKGHDLGEGSFSTNEALRELEFEAYKRGNGEIVREFEEQYKKSKEVSEMKLEENKKDIINEFEFPFRFPWWDKFIAKVSRELRKKLDQLELDKRDSEKAKEIEIRNTMDNITHKILQQIKNEKEEPESPRRPGPGQPRFLKRESLNNFVDSILNEINSDSYLLEQDTLKENKDMAEVKNPGKYKVGMKAGYDKDGDGVPNGADEDPNDGAVPEDIEEGKGKLCEPHCAEDLQEQEGGPDKLRAPKPGGECYVKVDQKGYQFKEGQPFYKNLKCLADALGENFTHKEGTNDIIEKKDGGKQGIHSFPQPKPRPASKPPIKEETNENWFKGNKDQLLFEELVKRWTK